MSRRQDPLRERYRNHPDEARITDSARTSRSAELDPFHGIVEATRQDLTVPVPFGIHRAVGGDHDLSNPGSLLCAALAACLDSTLRIIAGRAQIRFRRLEVKVTARLDVRGTLQVERDVPVGFQELVCRIEAEPCDDVSEKKLRRLVSAAERSCVVLQTLRGGVDVETRSEIQLPG